MGRRPDWVYGSGEEPDYRFSLANERTMLAWLRTGLALLAGGVAVDTIDLSMPAWVRELLAGLLVLLALLCAGGAWLGWARSERAIRNRQPMPAPYLGLVVALGVMVAAAVVLVAGL
jgi:putative membrane protein